MALNCTPEMALLVVDVWGWVKHKLAALRAHCIQAPQYLYRTLWLRLQMRQVDTGTHQGPYWKPKHMGMAGQEMARPGWTCHGGCGWNLQMGTLMRILTVFAQDFCAFTPPPCISYANVRNYYGPCAHCSLPTFPSVCKHRTALGT